MGENQTTTWRKGEDIIALTEDRGNGGTWRNGGERGDYEESMSSNNKPETSQMHKTTGNDACKVSPSQLRSSQHGGYLKEHGEKVAEQQDNEEGDTTKGVFQIEQQLRRYPKKYEE